MEKPVKFIAGTDGKMSYILLAELGRCVFSVKPEICVIAGPHGPVLLLQARMRVSGNPNIDLTREPLTATEIVKTFAHIPFENVDEKRASVTATIPVQIKAKTKSKSAAFTAIGDVLSNSARAETFVHLLHKMTKQSEFLCKDHFVASFLQEGWQEMFVGVTARLNKADAQKTSDEAVLGWIENAIKNGGKESA